jgi:hemin uptake protein HemP
MAQPPTEAPGTHTHPQANTAPRPGEEASRRDVVHRLDSASLLCGHTSVEITHRGSVYRLQATRQGKLILTK